MKIYCCECQNDVEAVLVYGDTIYPHRTDLYELPFWQCQACKNFVGTHWKTNNPTKPLGVIAMQELKNARKHIHAILDPLWQSGAYKRKSLYLKIAEKVGWNYHTAKLRNIEEAREIYRIIKQISIEK